MYRLNSRALPFLFQKRICYVVLLFLRITKFAYN